ncbi:phosphoglycerate mutase family protein [Streptomyces sp. NPDC056549]|uniref:phosphoglycerate mutase family protein n=1 Tax=Streptomyces sp. NPDC056549 TaxID=3345864 RepID=UPI0036C8A1A5
MTAQGFRQAVWLGGVLQSVVGERPVVFTSQYQRTRDTADLAMPAIRAEVTGLLNEQRYGDTTYMTMHELFATFPEEADDRRNRKVSLSGQNLAQLSTALHEGTKEGDVAASTRCGHPRRRRSLWPSA